MWSGGQVDRKSNYSLRQIIFEKYMSTVHRIDCLPLLLLSFIFWQYILLGVWWFLRLLRLWSIDCPLFSFFPFSSDISYGDLLECTKGFNFHTRHLFFYKENCNFFNFLLQLHHNIIVSTRYAFYHVFLSSSKKVANKLWTFFAWKQETVFTPKVKVPAEWWGRLPCRKVLSGFLCFPAELKRVDSLFVTCSILTLHAFLLNSSRPKKVKNSQLNHVVVLFHFALCTRTWESHELLAMGSFFFNFWIFTNAQCYF